MTYDMPTNSELAPLTEQEKHNIQKTTSEMDTWESIMPVPDSIEYPDFRHHLHGKPVGIYNYNDANGNLLFCVARYEQQDRQGKHQKELIPFTYCKNKETAKKSWRKKAPDGLRPLYGLYHLKNNPKARVIVVEGEKKAKIAQKVCKDCVFITSMGGANAADKTDWSPLEERDITIWRDNDKAGQIYQRDVFQQMTRVGAKSVVFVDLPHDLPKGWDVADAIDDGWDATRINNFIKKHTKQAKALPTLTLSELDAHDIPEERHYFPWLTEGSAIILVAKTGLGKTLFALGISTALANGTGFLKWENSLDPVGVLYIDGEMSLHDMRQRLRGFSPTMKTKAPLEILSHQEFWNVEESDLNLVEEKLQERLKNYLEKRPEIRVVVIDNLSCLFPTLREDKRDDWVTKALPFILWFRRRNIVIIMVHHTNKQGEQRGSGARLETLNLQITLSPLPSREDTEQAGFYVTFPKHRNVWGDAITPIEVTLHEEKDGALRWEWRSKEESSEEKLLSLVREGVERVKDAAEMMGLTEGAVSKLKKKLVDKGILQNKAKLALTGVEHKKSESDDEEYEEDED